MSAIVKTQTPFLNRSLLLEALRDSGTQFSERNELILIPQLDAYGRQCYFQKLSNGKYQLSHDSHARSIQSFLKQIGEHYDNALQRLLQRQEEEERQRIEEEKRRIEEERKQYVEHQKQTIIERAKQQGYSVREKMKGNKIQLQLVRQTY